MKVVFCGCGAFGIDCLDALAKSNHQLVGVFTHPASPAGRGRKLQKTAVANWAIDNNVEFIEIQDINSPEALEKLSALKPDLIVVIAFGQKISEQIISIPKKDAINVHASLLPKYRGAAPINWAIIDGQRKTGVSIITLAQTMDAGSILAQAKMPIEELDTAGDVHDRLAGISAPLLIDTIDAIEQGKANYQPQDESKATKAPKLKKQDGFIDWHSPAENICNLIRGTFPWPGAQCDYINRKTEKCFRITIALAKVIDSAAKFDLPPGLVNENLEVICGQGKLQILKIKPAGAKVMDFKDFVNGRAVKSGDVFLNIETSV